MTCTRGWLKQQQDGLLESSTKLNDEINIIKLKISINILESE